MKKALLIALSLVFALSLFVPASALLLIDEEGNPVDSYEFESEDGEMSFTTLLADSIGFEAGLSAPTLSFMPPMSMFGEIVEVYENGYVLVQDSYNENSSVILKPHDGTFILDAVTGLPATLEDRETDRVAVFYGPAATFSLPPQSTAVAIVINLPEGLPTPHYALVESIQRNEGSVRVLTDNGSLYITINEDTPVVSYETGEVVSLDDLRIGTKLMTWYSMVAMSYPGQTTALQAVLLADGPVPDVLTYDIETGIASVNGTELILSAAQTAEDGTALLPLRQICEAMGYDVAWNAEANAVELTRDDDLSITVTFDSAEVVRNYRDFTMTQAPVVENWVTLVPADFFTHVLFATVNTDA